MKYKVGDKTLLGEIDRCEENSCYCYRVENKCWLAELDIDKIIIKPKRNIDHIIELLEDGKEEQARKFYNELVPLSEGYAVADEIYYFLKPYTEPSKHPQLTPEEIKALKLARDCGFADISRSSETDYTILFNYANYGMDYCLCAHEVPSFSVLCDANWINGKGQSISELLKDEV